MKLSKAKLIKLVKPKLEDLGYTEFKYSGWQGLFVKKLENGLYLSLGLTIHRYYDTAFTGDFYLSTNTCIGAQWGDIPKECYKRPGHFLLKEERELYLDKEHNETGVVDVWWDSGNQKSVSDFLSAIEITEPRFINQPELFKQIERSQEIKTLSNFAEKVITLVKKDALKGTYSFIPTKEIDNIPIIWFKASEEVIANAKDILNKHTVFRLAADAYRQFELDKL